MHDESEHEGILTFVQPFSGARSRGWRGQEPGTGQEECPRHNRTDGQADGNWRSGEGVTGEDGLSAQISKKFVSRRSDVECRVDDPAVEGASLARLADRQDTPLVGDFVRDLHRTVHARRDR